MGLSRDEIQKRLAERYASEDPKLLKEVSYNLTIAGVTEENLNTRAEQALERLRTSAKNLAPQKALQSAKRTTAHNKLAVCPICKTEMESVKIMDDRDVYFCTQHRVCQPYPVAEGDV